MKGNRGGRPPKPTQLHQLHGTYRQDRHTKRVDATLTVEGDLDEPPPDLTASQEDVWRYAVAHMPRGVMKKIDREVLMLWCEAADRHNTARLMQAMLDRDTQLKLLVKGQYGLDASPYHDILDKTAKIMIRIAQELGFSPATRARIKLAPPPTIDGKVEEDDLQADPWSFLALDGRKDLPN